MDILVVAVSIPSMFHLYYLYKLWVSIKELIFLLIFDYFLVCVCVYIWELSYLLPENLNIISCMMKSKHVYSYI